MLLTDQQCLSWCRSPLACSAFGYCRQLNFPPCSNCGAPLCMWGTRGESGAAPQYTMTDRYMEGIAEGRRQAFAEAAGIARETLAFAEREDDGDPWNSGLLCAAQTIVEAIEAAAKERGGR